ncbi:hypothetical protein A9Q74_13710 [Colwellia sp. 39_35_sub15_T18]|nr:hypothetical protein A9Q74_13710 [Colwellia sp. 39_35_sub15_T18]
MPPLKLVHRPLPALLTLGLFIFTQFSIATEFEIMPIVGNTFSPDLESSDNTTTLATTDEQHLGVAFSWRDSPTGQGQILVNYIARDVTDQDSQAIHAFDTLYTHFSGVALFKDRGYTTTVGLGLGATYFNSDFDSAVYPSFTASVGTRYNFSDNVVFITELRAYATLIKEDSSLFCQNDSCLAQFDGAIWFDSQISVGLAYAF